MGVLLPGAKKWLFKFSAGASGKPGFSGGERLAVSRPLPQQFGEQGESSVGRQFALGEFGAGSGPIAL